MHNEFAAKDFSAKTLKALTKADWVITGCHYKPDYSKALPFADPDLEYSLHNEFTCRKEYLSHSGVLALAEQK